MLAGVAHLGFVADLLSKPTQIGYMDGLAITILIGQLPKLFGFSVDADGLIDGTVGFVKGLARGETVAAALAVGVASLVLILLFQRWLSKVPGVLVAVVLSIVAVVAFDLASHGVALVGTLPQGFPPFTVPDVSVSDVGLLVCGALVDLAMPLAEQNYPVLTCQRGEGLWSSGANGPSRGAVVPVPSRWRDTAASLVMEI